MGHPGCSTHFGRGEGDYVGRCFGDVGLGVELGFVGGPGETGEGYFLEEGVGPDVFSVAHGGVEDTALAVGLGPGGGVGGALVHGVAGLGGVHGGRVLDEDDVEVVGEVHEVVPLFLEGGVFEVFEAGEVFGGDLHAGLELGPVAGEFAADHFDVGGADVLVLDVADEFRLFVDGLVAVVGAVEGVGCAVEADEAFAGGDVVEEDLLAVGRHGGALVVLGVTLAGVVPGEVFGGVEGEGVVLLEAFGGEDGAVLGAGDVVAGGAAELGEEALGVGEFSVLARDDGVGEAAGFGEEEDLLAGAVLGE